MYSRHPSRRLAGLAGALTAVLLLAACGSGFSGDESPTSGDTGTGGGGGAAGELTVLIGSSGEAETAAVTAAVDAWAQSTGNTATVRNASNLIQELSQGFAAGQPPDLFYVTGDQFETLAANDSLFAYGDQLGSVSDFFPSLVELFSRDGEFYCAPKDFSTLTLVINTDDWTAAGLTDTDYPTTWNQLAAVAEKLTVDGRVGLALNSQYERVGVFLAQGGGSMISDDGTTATVASPENVAALQYVKDRLNAGSFAWSSAVGAGWGGEALGTHKASMTIEGNWIAGAMATDYPEINWKAVELPGGPGGEGTLQFSTCWGIGTDSPNRDTAVDLAEYLTDTAQQAEFSKAFGVMPSVQSAAAAYTQAFPEMRAFIESADFAQNIVTVPGWSAVLNDFNAQLEALATGDPQAILTSVQTNLQALLDENNA